MTASETLKQQTPLPRKSYLGEKEVAELTGISVFTLRNHRFLRRGIPFLKVGMRTVKYRMEDVCAYMEKVRIDPEDRG